VYGYLELKGGNFRSVELWKCHKSVRSRTVVINYWKTWAFKANHLTSLIILYKYIHRPTSTQTVCAPIST